MMPIAFRLAQVAAAFAAATCVPAAPALAAPPVAAPPGPAPAGYAAQPADPELVTWGVRPADTSYGTQRPNFAHTADPGATVSDALLVTNYHPEPLTLDVYAVDAYTSSQGELAARLAGEESTGAGGWITLDSGQVTIPPEESATVPFTLHVPAGAEPGDHSAAILTSLVAEDAGSGVAVDRRLGSRLHVRVTGEAIPALDIVDLRVQAGHPANPFAGRPVEISYTVVNSGNLRLAGVVEVVLQDLAGRDLGGELSPEALVVPEILPGGRVDLVAEVTRVGAPLLRLQADVTVRPQAAPGPAPPVPADPAAARRGVWVVPWLVLVAAGLTALGGVGWRLGRRRARQRFEARVAAAVAGAAA